MNKLSFDVDTYEGEILTPKYLLEFDYSISNEIKDDINLLVIALSTDILLEIENITLKYMNSGSGTISFRTSYKLEKQKSAEEIKLFHEKLSSDLSHIANKLIEYCTGKLKKELTKPYILRCDEDSKPSLAWMHRIFYVQMQEDELRNIDNIDYSFIIKQNQILPINASITENLNFYPSIGNSQVIFVNHEQAESREFRALENVIEYINCNWLSMIEMDKKLFYQINELGRNNDQLKLKDLEIKYNLISDLCEEITLFKSILFNHKINLSPQEHKIWECVAEIWHLDELINSVTTKSETLKEMNKGILDRLQNKQNNKLNYLVFVFTTISFLTIILQAIDFVQQSVNVPNILRTLTMLFLTITVVFSVRKLRNWLFG
ncbi:hypothetical protein [Pedobacter sp.]|uniref:hypothetical protein n=1 Tax=Pedobacter sp. TaxID=1411316 RepID=UPI003BA90CC3